MNYFLYKIGEDEIRENCGEIPAVPEGFIEYQNTLGIDRIYYKIQDSKITEVIGEADSEETARRRVGDFLSAFHVNIF
ncbi:MAG TPA: hypothetical protein VK806_05080 [Bacteroidia bacterium]|jgi:hypothetical protein|nr:hypothetical protein [Bacteroidia bacterium]